MAIDRWAPPYLRHERKQDFDRITEMLSALIGTDAAQLDDSTPCSDFAVRDLIGHFTLGRFLFAAGLQQTRARRRTAAGMPARMGDVVADGHKETYRDASERLEHALEGFPDLDQPVSLVFGEMPGSYALQMLSADNFIHCWDLATATGQQFDPPEDLIESTHAFFEGFITDASRDGGSFAPAVEVAADSSSLDRLLSLCGRRA